MKHSLYIIVLIFFSSLNGCSDDYHPGYVSHNYPYLISNPVVSYIQTVNNSNLYDVTISFEADGPDGVYAIDFWIHEEHIIDANVNGVGIAHLNANYIGGNQWQITTDPMSPLPSGSYSLLGISLYDNAIISNELVRETKYGIRALNSKTHYVADQKLTMGGHEPAIEGNFGVSDISFVNFTLP